MNIKNKFVSLKNKKDIFFIGFAVLVVAALVVYGFYFRKPVLNAKDAQAVAENFINKNLVSPGTKVTVKGVSDESGLYRVAINVNGQDINSYITKDGKMFFPQGLNIADIEKQNSAANSQASSSSQASADPPKSEKPNVELFVMSYCPYGTQTEKGILPAIAALGSKINFTLKFVDYSMHGQKEIDENLRQYCVQKDQAGKFQNYLSCFLKAGDSAGCLASAGVDAAKMNACVAQTDNQYSIAKDYKDQSTWIGGQYPPFNVNQADNQKYNVQGSPTLVINGQTVSAQRTPASLLKAICSSFTNSPSECFAKLSSEAPSPGFGEGASSGGGAGSSCSH